MLCALSVTPHSCFSFMPHESLGDFFHGRHALCHCQRIFQILLFHIICDHYDLCILVILSSLDNLRQTDTTVAKYTGNIGQYPDGLPQTCE